MRSESGIEIIVAMFLASSALAQELVWEVTGVQNVSWIGGQVAVVGDIDGDGYDDIANLGGDPSVQGTLAQLFFLSGTDGRILRARSPWPQNAGYMTIAAAGDMDGDAVPDYAGTFVTGQGGWPLIEVRSGKDDSLIWSVQPSANAGIALLGNLDLDADRRPDLVVTAPQETPNGVLYCYTNQGILLRRIDGSSLQLYFVFQSNETLGCIGDFNRDGNDDFLVGGFDGVAMLWGAFVICGRTGNVLARGLHPQPQYLPIGGSVDGCGDLDADGVLDFAVGSAGACCGPLVGYAFSGGTGQPLFSWGGYPGSGVAEIVKSGGLDFDQDGVPDIVVAGPERNTQSNIGRTAVLSGRDGGLLHGVLAPTNCTYASCFSLDVMHSTPNSPFPLFVLPEIEYGYYYIPKWNYSVSQGRVRLFRGKPAGAQLYGSACQGALAKEPRIGMRNLFAQGVRLHLSDAEPGSPAALLVGLSRTSIGGAPLPYSLNPLGFSGCQLFTSIDAWVPVLAGTTGTSRGYAFFDIPNPLATGTPWVTLYGQWVSLGLGAAAPGALSAAMQWQH